MSRNFEGIEVFREGFSSRSAFMGAWAAIHRDLGPVDVWRIELRADPIP